MDKSIDIVPNYHPDPEQDPPTVVIIITEEIKEREAIQKETQVLNPKFPLDEKKRDDPKKVKDISLWWYKGGGVLALVAIVVLALSGGDDGGETPNELPNPPDLP